MEREGEREGGRQGERERERQRGKQSEREGHKPTTTTGHDLISCKVCCSSQLSYKSVDVPFFISPHEE